MEWLSSSLLPIALVECLLWFIHPIPKVYRHGSFHNGFVLSFFFLQQLIMDGHGGSFIHGNKRQGEVTIRCCQYSASASKVFKDKLDTTNENCFDNTVIMNSLAHFTYSV